MRLLDVQKDAIESILNLLQSEKEIELVGKLGTGKRYILNSSEMSSYNIININNEKTLNSLDPIKNALFPFRDKLNRKQYKFNMGLSYSIFSIGISSRTDNELFKERNAIIKSIKKLVKCSIKRDNKLGVIIAIKKSECTYIINDAINQLKKIEKLHIIWMAEKASNKMPFVNVLPFSESKEKRQSILTNFGLDYEKSNNLNENEINFLFKISNNNINILKKAITGIQNNTINFKSEIDSEAIIKNILSEYNFNDVNNKNQIFLLLKFCARTLYPDDNATIPKLAFLMKQEINQTKVYIEQSKDLEILCENQCDVKFTLALLKNIFLSLSENDCIQIYNLFVDMIAKLQPSNYKLKYLYADKAKNENSLLFKIQYYMQEIRKNRAVNIDELIIDDNYKNILRGYRQMCLYMNNHEYDSVTDLTHTLDIQHPILICEFKILYVQALMKSLEDEKRNKALSLIQSIDANHYDGDLKYRIKMCHMTALVHVGEYKTAQNVYSELCQELVNEISKHHSDELTRNLNLLYRKNNMVYDYQSSEIFIAKSKEYFQSRFNDFTDYFFAIANALGIHLKNMHLDKAAEDIKDFETLQQNHMGKIFKREFIYHINKLVYQYFSDPSEKSAESVAKEYYKMINATQNMHGDQFLIANNYAAFTALSGDVQGAFKYLQSIEPTNLNDKEGIYIYKYKVNKAVFQYILDNSKKDELIAMLSEITFDENYPNWKVMNTELKLIINTMKNGNCKNMEDWLIQYYKQLPDNRPNNGYEQGLVITIVFNWDDD